MLKFKLCVIYCLQIFLYRDVNTKCSGYLPVKANLNFTSVGEYFSFTSKTPNVRDMLKGSGKIFKGPAGKDVTVSIKGMSFGRLILIDINDMRNIFQMIKRRAGCTLLFVSVNINKKYVINLN